MGFRGRSVSAGRGWTGAVLPGDTPEERRDAFLFALAAAASRSEGGWTVTPDGLIRERGTCFCPLVAGAVDRGAEGLTPDNGDGAGILLGLATKVRGDVMKESDNANRAGLYGVDPNPTVTRAELLAALRIGDKAGRA